MRFEKWPFLWGCFFVFIGLLTIRIGGHLSNFATWMVILVIVTGALLIYMSKKLAKIR